MKRSGVRISYAPLLFLAHFLAAVGDFWIGAKSAKVRQIPLKSAKTGNFPIFWQPGWQPAGWLQGSTHGVFSRSDLISHFMKQSANRRIFKSLLPEGFPEFAVSRDTIRSFFHPEISTSTFHDFVKNGVVIPVDGLRGFYKLNESLLRLGLRPVSSLPTKNTRSSADMLRLAFSMIEPRLFPTPGWALDCAFDPFQEDALKYLVLTHGSFLATLKFDEEKLGYLAGAIDAYDKLEAMEN